jgi:hypothetical protein
MSPQNQERALWWKVAQHLDDAQKALISVMALNTDDPTFIHGLQAMLRDGQAVLYEIFRSKGLLPAAQQPPVATASMPPPPPPHAATPGPMPVPPPPPKAPVVVVEEAQPHDEHTNGSNGATKVEALDYDGDAGKGFENDEPVAEPA